MTDNEELATLRAEIERLKVANEGWHQRVGMLKADDEANRARIAELEADVVWCMDMDSGLDVWSTKCFAVHNEIGEGKDFRHDGTPADILRAVREARNGVS